MLFITLAYAGMAWGKSAKSAKSGKSSKSDGNDYTIIHHVKDAKSAKSIAKSPKSAKSVKTKKPTTITKSPTKRTKSPSNSCPIKPQEINTYLCPHWVTCPDKSSFVGIKDKPYTQEIIIGGSLEEGLRIHPGDALPALGDTVYFLWAGADGKVNISWGSNDCNQDAYMNPRIVLFQTRLSADAGTAVFSSYTFDSYIISFESFVLAGVTAYTTLDFQIEFFENGDLHFCYGPLVIGADAFFEAGLGVEFPMVGYTTEIVVAVLPASGLGAGVGAGVGGYISLIPDGACHCLSFQCPDNGK